MYKGYDTAELRRLALVLAESALSALVKEVNKELQRRG